MAAHTLRYRAGIGACFLLAAACVAPRAPEAPAGLAPLDASLVRGLEIADSLVGAGVGTLYPGAVLLVSKDGQVVHHRAYGFAQLRDAEGRRLDAPPPMRTTTMFDLASVTKVAATTTSLMVLVGRGRIDLDAPVRRYLPDFRGPHLDSITVRHLLQHSSGLVQWQPLYYQARTAAETYQAIRRMPLGWGVGAGRHYSDLGFMLLGYIVEQASGTSLDRFAQRELFERLALRSTTFAPQARGLVDIAATETGNAYERQMVHDPNFGYDYAGDPNAWNRWRRGVTIGETNDGNAWYAHGGFAGHAGLFSTAADLRVILQLLLDRGVAQGRRLLSTDVVDRFLTRDRYGHYLGWQFPVGMPEGSFAHTGFTGTYVLGVPSRGLAVVLLTNRQNMGRNERGFFPDIGPLQRAIGSALVNETAP